MPCGWLEIQDRLARVAAEQLALQAGTEPTDPEPAVAGWALAGLVAQPRHSDRRAQRLGIAHGLGGHRVVLRL